MSEYADYAWLVSDDAAPHLARAAVDERPELQQLKSLRRDLTPERARLVVEQIELRRRGRPKFGDLAARMFFSPVHLEQATDRWVGQYKAERISPGDSGPSLVHDYCCGIGGDLIWLSRRGPSRGVDVAEVACLFAAANISAVGGEAVVDESDVAEQTPGGDDRWHVDPDRRSTGGRTTAVERYSPGPEVIDGWLAHAPSGAVKLAPAAVVPDAWAEIAELEWITSHRECRQQIAWFGSLATAPGSRRATSVGDRDGSHAVHGNFTGRAGVPLEYVDEPRRYLFDPDPAILAAGLLGALAQVHRLSSLGSGSAYLTGEHKTAAPLLQAFAVFDVLPLKAPAVAQYLAARQVGRVEIKKRGVAVDPAKFRSSLKLRGDDEATVVLTRVGKREVALVCQRLPPAEGVTEPRPVS